MKEKNKEYIQITNRIYSILIDLEEENIKLEINNAIEKGIIYFTNKNRGKIEITISNDYYEKEITICVERYIADDGEYEGIMFETIEQDIYAKGLNKVIKNLIEYLTTKEDTLQKLMMKLMEKINDKWEFERCELLHKENNAHPWILKGKIKNNKESFCVKLKEIKDKIVANVRVFSDLKGEAITDVDLETYKFSSTLDFVYDILEILEKMN